MRALPCRGIPAGGSDVTVEMDPESEWAARQEIEKGGLVQWH